MTKWKYNIGDNVIDEKRNFTITDREIKYMDHYKKPCHQKWYKLTCNICGWDEGWKSEKSLCSDKKGCACCRGRVVVKGINDIATKAPYIIPYLLNPEDAYKYTPYSTAIIKTKCPICGEIREYRIAQLTSYPYVCNRCGKHLSVPERFFYEFLKFYNIDFIPQLSSAKMAWCGKYRYDFYIPIINAIIELHGRQHYELGIYKRSYDDIRQRDIEKIKLALKNGIKCYSIVPFVRSEKNQLIEVLLNHEIIDLLNIDRTDLRNNLEKCFEKVWDNKMIEICNYYTHHPDLSAVEIGRKFKVSSPYVLQALHDGADLGLCAYDGQNKLKQTLQQNRITQGIPIESIQPDGKIHTFIGIREASRMSELLFGKHLSRYFIKKYCATGEMWNGIMFKYVKK